MKINKVSKIFLIILGLTVFMAAVLFFFVPSKDPGGQAGIKAILTAVVSLIIVNLIPYGIEFVTWLLIYKAFPAKESIPPEVMKANEKEYRKIYILSNLSTLILCPVLSVLSYLAFAKIMDLYFLQIDSMYLIRMDKVFLMLSAFFLGLILCVPVVKVILLVLLKERYYYFERHYEVVLGLDTKKLWKAIYIVYFAIITLPLLFYFTSFTKITDREIITFGITDWAGEAHRFDEVAEIQKELWMKGEEEKGRYIVYYRDRKKLETYFTVGGIQTDYLDRVIGFISEKSNRPIAIIRE